MGEYALHAAREVELMIHVVFTSLLLIGVLGLLAQLLIGGHFGHHAPRIDSSNRTGQHVGGVRSSGASRRAAFLLSVLSPITFFSLCLGAGATGLLTIHYHRSPTFVISGAIIGGIAFYSVLIRPIMALMLNFASNPSAALEGSLAKPAEVVSRFDSSGKGLVKLTVDGQIVRILATLEDADRASASELSPGDQVLVTYIDGHSNACRVARF